MVIGIRRKADLMPCDKLFYHAVECSVHWSVPRRRAICIVAKAVLPELIRNESALTHLLQRTLGVFSQKRAHQAHLLIALINSSSLFAFASLLRLDDEL